MAKDAEVKFEGFTVVRHEETHLWRVYSEIEHVQTPWRSSLADAVYDLRVLLQLAVDLRMTVYDAAKVLRGVGTF